MRVLISESFIVWLQPSNHIFRPLWPLVLWPSPSHLLLLPCLKSWTPPRYLWRLDSTCAKLLFMLISWSHPMNHEFFLMASKMVNPVQKIFHSTLSRSIGEMTVYGSSSLMKCFSSIIRLQRQNNSSIHGLQNECCFSGHGSSIYPVVHLHQSSRVARYNILKGVFFFWA